jgi:hypothetical protein
MAAIEREPPPASPSPSADAIPRALRRGGGTARQVLAVAMIGTLVLAVFASHDLAAWLDRMGDGPVVVPLQRAASAWDGAMARLGLTLPSEALREAMQGVLDRTWPGAP